MTCADWRAVSIDLARGVPLSSVSRAEAQAHVARCPDCARFHDEQQWLTRALNDLRRVDETCEPSAALDQRVLAAWQARDRRGPPVVAPVTVETPPVSFWTWRRVGLAAVAAAAAIALVGLIHARWFQSSPPFRSTPVHPASVQASAVQAGLVRPGAIQRSAGRKRVSAQTESLQTERPQTESLQTERPQAESLQTKSVQKRTMPPAARRASAVPAGGSRQRAAPAAPLADIADTADTVNEATFVRLPYAEPLRSTEMRQVVRVTIPRTDRMGRVVAPARQEGGAAVVADVLVGEDGMARAIRIIR
jgi:hypothetical protein